MSVGSGERVSMNGEPVSVGNRQPVSVRNAEPVSVVNRELVCRK